MVMATHSYAWKTRHGREKRRMQQQTDAFQLFTLGSTTKKCSRKTRKDQNKKIGKK